MRIFETRNPTLFEKALLIVGIGILASGFYVINKLYIIDGGVSWSLVIASFLWLLLILTAVLVCSTQDIKEELAILIREGNEEVKLLRTQGVKVKKK